MCLGIPGQVVEILDAENDIAMVDVSGVRRPISVRLLAASAPGPGDWVLVHVGFAMALIDETEAQLTLRAIEHMGQDYVDELTAFRESRIT